jgi:ribosomal protein S18 acetylase RimI-like enzyme
MERRPKWMNDVTNMKCENITDDIIQEYQQKGYELVFQEYVMEHSLTDIPKIETPFPLIFKSWSPSLKEPFYEVYEASFKDRPGFPGWPREKWVEWISSGSDFLPERSYIATINDRAVGFIAADQETDTIGYIIQVGVIPEWRGKGIAAVLTCKCLEDLRQDGMKSVVLHVNQNNPGAIKLYERIGFKTVRKRGTFGMTS